MEPVESTSSVSTPRVYRYRDAQLNEVFHTSVPKDDEAAIAYFHTVVRFGPSHKPVFVERVEQVPGEGEVSTALDTVFDPETMETKPYASHILSMYQF